MTRIFAQVVFAIVLATGFFIIPAADARAQQEYKIYFAFEDTSL